jgi:hypothetical protein
MQTPHKAVRYYIDREADTPVIRSVPVFRPAQSHVHTIDGTATSSDGATPADTSTQHLAHQSRYGVTRHRLAHLVQASVRRKQRDER